MFCPLWTEQPYRCSAAVCGEICQKRWRHSGVKCEKPQFQTDKTAIHKVQAKELLRTQLRTVIFVQKHRKKVNYNRYRSASDCPEEASENGPLQNTAQKKGTLSLYLHSHVKNWLYKTQTDSPSVRRVERRWWDTLNYSDSSFRTRLSLQARESDPAWRGQPSPLLYLKKTCWMFHHTARRYFTYLWRGQRGRETREAEKGSES